MQFKIRKKILLTEASIFSFDNKTFIISIFCCSTAMCNGESWKTEDKLHKIEIVIEYDLII